MVHVTTEADALEFVALHGIVLESAAGPVPSLAQAIVGAPISASWWGHPDAKTIFVLTRAVRRSEDVLVCKAIGGKVTFIHRRLWPALSRLSECVCRGCLDRLAEEHTRTGKHIVHKVPFPDWLPEEAVTAARSMTVEKAKALLKVTLD